MQPTLFKTEPYPVVFTDGFFRLVKRLIEPEEFVTKFGKYDTDCDLGSWVELQDEIIEPEKLELITSLYLGSRKITSKKTDSRSNEFRESVKRTLYSLLGESFTYLNPDPRIKYFSLVSWWGSSSSGHKDDLKKYILHPTLQVYVPNRVVDRQSGRER